MSSRVDSSRRGLRRRAAGAVRADLQAAAPLRRETERLLAAVPGAIRLLLDGAGGLSLRAAEKRVRDRTGADLSPSTLSKWMRGEISPTLAHLLPLLVALDVGLRDLDAALRETMREPTDDLPVELAERLRSDPRLREEVRSLLAETAPRRDAAGAEAPRELLDILEEEPFPPDGGSR